MDYTYASNTLHLLPKHGSLSTVTVCTQTVVRISAQTRQTPQGMMTVNNGKRDDHPVRMYVYFTQHYLIVPNYAICTATVPQVLLTLLKSQAGSRGLLVGDPNVNRASATRHYLRYNNLSLATASLFDTTPTIAAHLLAFYYHLSFGLELRCSNQHSLPSYVTPTPNTNLNHLEVTSQIHSTCRQRRLMSS
jgi:hypothetical protein